MLVILREGIRGLGKAGDVVDVKRGHGRNFLIPSGRAVVASKSNIKVMEEKRSVIELENQLKAERACVASIALQDRYVALLKQAGEDGKLFGSVTAREISKSLVEMGFDVHHSCILMPDPIRYLGKYTVKLELHHDVVADFRVFVARSESEVANLLGSKNEESMAASIIEQVSLPASIADNGSAESVDE